MSRYKKAKKPAIRCRFDYDAFEALLKARGGIVRCAKAAGLHHGSYYYVKNTQPLPLSRPIRRLLEFLDPTPDEIRNLFIKNKPSKSI